MRGGHFSAMSANPASSHPHMPSMPPHVTPHVIDAGMTTTPIS